MFNTQVRENTRTDENAFRIYYVCYTYTIGNILKFPQHCYEIPVS